MAGRHRASKHNPSYSTVKARGVKSHAARRGGGFRAFMAPLFPSYTPSGGWPRMAPVGEPSHFTFRFPTSAPQGRGSKFKSGTYGSPWRAPSVRQGSRGGFWGSAT